MGPVRARVDVFELFGASGGAGIFALDRVSERLDGRDAGAGAGGSDHGGDPGGSGSGKVEREVEGEDHCDGAGALDRTAYAGAGAPVWRFRPGGGSDGPGSKPDGCVRVDAGYGATRSDGA